MKSICKLLMGGIFVTFSTNAGAQMPTQCCGDVGAGFTIDFADPGVTAQLVPPPPGSPLNSFQIQGVQFTRIWDTIKYDGQTLQCSGGIEFPPGVWNEATVRMDFFGLSCLVCSVIASGNPHGPEVNLHGYKWGNQGPAASDGAEGNQDFELHIKSDAKSPFISATIGGEETEIRKITVN